MSNYGGDGQGVANDLTPDHRSRAKKPPAAWTWISPAEYHLAHAIRDVLRRYDLMSSLEELHRAMVPVLMRTVRELEERLR